MDAVEVIPVPKHDCVGLRFANPIKTGTRAWLAISFKGTISQNLEGKLPELPDSLTIVKK